MYRSVIKQTYKAQYVCFNLNILQIFYDFKVILYNFLGEIMEELATKLIKVHKCSFEPKHKNNLANQFACFTNFVSELD